MNVAIACVSHTLYLVFEGNYMSIVSLWTLQHALFTGYIFSHKGTEVLLHCVFTIAHYALDFFV